MGQTQGGGQGGQVFGDTQNGSFGNVGNGTLSPGQQIPYTQGGDSPLQSAYGKPSTQTSQSFLDPSLVAPYYNAAGVAGNLGSASAQNVAPANQFMQQLWNPNLNNFETSFLQAGLGNSQNLLEQGMTRQEDQFENTPFHSALPRAQGEVANQFARDAAQTGASMGMQRQQIGASVANQPFQQTLQSAMVGPQMSEQMFNMYNQAYNAPYNMPLSYYAQSPMISPTIIPHNSGGSK